MLAYILSLAYIIELGDGRDANKKKTPHMTQNTDTTTMHLS